MIFATGKSRLALAAAAGFMMVQVSEPAGAQSVSLKLCQTLAEMFAGNPASFTVNNLDNLASCVANYRAQRGGVAGETGSLGAKEFSGGTPTFREAPEVPRRPLNLQQQFQQRLQ